ncbi:MAG: IPT/TIG domain-containing protein, partial [Methanosarcina sp.]
AVTTVTLTLKGQTAGVPLLPVKKVMFGNVEATFVTVDSQKITAVAPPQVAGTKAAVKLVTAGGSSTNNPKFTYQ